MAMLNNHSVLILGGGFTGLFAALYLRQHGFQAQISLIDRETRFIFRPLLYDLLTREVQVDMVWPRYDELLLPKDIKFITGEIDAVDLTRRQVRLTSDLVYDYDYLVLGLGGSLGYFNVPGAKEHTFGFRNGEDAFSLGRHLRLCLQQARQQPERQPQLLTIAIVGAGPSGVELAATLGDLLPQWYENLDGDITQLKIVMLQRGDMILQQAATDQLRATAREALSDRNVSVDVFLETTVTQVTPDGVWYQKHDQDYFLPSATVIWTAGNDINPLIRALPVSDQNRDRQGRLKLLPTLQLPGYPDVFAGGDCAVNEADPQPATAQVAYQQGKAIATNIMALAQGEALQPASITLRGTLLKLGMNVGVAEIFDKYAVTGHPAHLIRQGVYLNLLPTPVRNLKQDAQWLTEEFFEQVLSS